VDRGNAQALGMGLVLLRGTRPVASAGIPIPPTLLTVLLPLRQGVTLKSTPEYRAVALGVSGRPTERVVVIAPISTLEDEQRRSGYGLAAAAGPIVLFAVLMGAWLARKSFAPIENMRRVVQHIARSRSLKTRLRVAGNDELSRLGGTLDEMLNRLEQSFDRERAFIGDVSHELRNSLGAIIAEADHALSKPRDASDYSIALAAIVARARRLASAVDDLLLLARADAGALPKNEAVDLNDVAARVCADVQRRSDGLAVTVELSDEPVLVLGRTELISRAMENLVVNARNAAKQHVLLRVSCHAGSAIVQIDDDGPGVPTTENEAIFRRFHRGDVSYAGSGLGLPLVAAIAGAYGGTISVVSSARGGASFILKLPQH
jgi:signal transduction histidine kinase